MDRSSSVLLNDRAVERPQNGENLRTKPPLQVENIIFFDSQIHGIVGIFVGRQRHRHFRLDESPALEDLDDEVFARGQRLVAVRGAGLSASLVQVSVQPDAKLTTGKNNNMFIMKTFHLAIKSVK